MCLKGEPAALNCLLVCFALAQRGGLYFNAPEFIVHYYVHIAAGSLVAGKIWRGDHESPGQHFGCTPFGTASRYKLVHHGLLVTLSVPVFPCSGTSDIGAVAGLFDRFNNMEGDSDFHFLCWVPSMGSFLPDSHSLSGKRYTLEC